MFKTTLVISFLFLTSAFAAGKPTYKLNIDLNMNSISRERLTSQSVIVVADDQVTLEQGKYTFITVTPSQIIEEPGRVHLKLIIGVIKKGTRQIISTPEMIVSEGRTGSITVGEDDGPESFTLTVLANRQAVKK